MDQSEHRRTKARHGRHSPVFAAWLAIQARGRVCVRWKSFSVFYCDVHPKPSWRHWRVRRDVSREFSPTNARWQVAKWYRQRPRTARTC